MSFFKISRSNDTSFLNLICHEALDPHDEPVPKIQKISHKVVEYLPITADDMETFFALLEDKVIAAFLEYDRFCCLADKYLIAMVMTYFKRAGLSYKEYSTYNFFVALHLAHDMEEDEEELKYKFVRWLFGTNWEEKHNAMLIKRDELWKTMNYRGLVSKKCCEEVVAMLPEHPIWQRQRQEVHGGAKRALGLKWSPKMSVIDSLEAQSSASEYESGSEDDESDNFLSQKRGNLATEEMKSYVIDGMGRISSLNKQDNYSAMACSGSIKKKFKSTFSLFEE